MKNYVQDGDVLPLVAPYQRNGGQGALVGSLFGVAVSDVANAVQGQFRVEGVFDLDKVAAEVWTTGALIYWDNTAKLVTTVPTSNKLIGVATEARANPTTTGRVRLNGAFIS